MSDKEKNLNETLSQIEKQFGKGTVMKMGDREIVDMPSDVYTKHKILKTPVLRTDLWRDGAQKSGPSTNIFFTLAKL